PSASPAAAAEAHPPRSTGRPRWRGWNAHGSRPGPPETIGRPRHEGSPRPTGGRPAAFENLAAGSHAQEVLRLEAPLLLAARGDPERAVVEAKRQVPRRAHHP